MLPSSPLQPAQPSPPPRDIGALLIREGKSRDEVIAAMQAKIEELGPRNVSHHACNPSTLNVIDIAPSSIPTNKRRAFVEAFQAARRLGIVKEFLKPPEDFAYHIEIRQP